MLVPRLLLLLGALASLISLCPVQAADDDAAGDDDSIQYWGEYAILPKRCIV